jgi:hypothetical protein
MIAKAATPSGIRNALERMATSWFDQGQLCGHRSPALALD